MGVRVDPGPGSVSYDASNSLNTIHLPGCQEASSFGSELWARCPSAALLGRPQGVGGVGVWGGMGWR